MTSTTVVVDPTNDWKLDDTEWQELSPILAADPKAAYLFDSMTQASVQEDGLGACGMLQAKLTMQDVMLTIEQVGGKPAYNEAVLAEMRVAMPYLCAQIFATAKT